MKISVIVPTYNRPVLLERALQTIEAQTIKDYEVIVVNDAGIDVSHIVDRFSNTSYVEHVKNAGLSAARNTGIKLAMGDYITFLDDDDLLSPVHFATLSSALDRGADAAYTDAYWWENEIVLINRLSVDYSYQTLQAYNLWPVMCVMIRREHLQKNLFDEGLPSHEDYDLWLRLGKLINFEHIKAITAFYSKRGDADQISEKDYHPSYCKIVQKRNK